MKKIRVLLYGIILLTLFVLLHIYFPETWSSGVFDSINSFFTNPLGLWWFVFPLIGLCILLGFVLYYGIHFLASFGRLSISKEVYHPNVSIVIASKDEELLLKNTLKSIANLNFPKEKLQIVVVTSGSSDNSTSLCQKFAENHTELDIEVLSEEISKKGKPAALNYGLEYVKNEIFVLYDSGCVLTPNTLTNLVSPFKEEDKHAVIGPVLVKNWKDNLLTRAILLDYSTIAGGGMLFEVKNRLGSSAYSFGRNFAVRTRYLRKYGGFNEDSLTEDLYLSVLLNLDNIKIYFAPKAKVYDYVPNNWEALVKQRTRWMAGYVLDSPDLMELEGHDTNGKSIIISRNLTMMLIGNMDSWMPIVIAFAILYLFLGEYYLLTWTLSCLLFQFGFLLNAIRKYADKHYSLIFLFFLSGFIHLYMFLRQFNLPEDLDWEKTPVILEKEELAEEVTN
ncbi:MAG: glycosyltransferase [Candidatus Lokiarchaeota archaeon]|nr:glycosyltransferase [Candidatus Lokiarchaeota archaeon]MBD3201651.1 glycosyltransferase [Candidatus Lokiarchaeota archaeon]